MKYPEQAEINGKLYKINTDFRIAIQCDKIAKDNKIGDLERALAIIYLLFGEEALNDLEDANDFLEVSKKFLSCNKEVKNTGEKPDMDFIQDMDYIEASFMSDFHIDLEKTEMHWWKFMNLINGLSNSELGNCCILNNIRNIRNTDLSEIKDEKTRRKVIKAKEMFALKEDEIELTKEEQEALDEFNKLAGI